jgi:hypothetical protein
MFDIATRQKLRFVTSRGVLTVEDLWDLPLTSATGKANLDDLAIALHQELKTTTDVVSFVNEEAKPDSTVKLRFDIIKHIIDVRKKENADAANARKRAELKQQLLAVLERKQTAGLEALSEEELRKKISEL